MHFITRLAILLLAATLIVDISSKKHGKVKKEWRKKVCECGTTSMLPNLENNGGSHEKYPWVVNLMDKKRNMTTFCIGTVVSPSLILTASSCLLETGENDHEGERSAKKGAHISCFKPRSDIAIGFPLLAETFGIFSKGGASVKKIMPHSHPVENCLEEDLVLLRIYPTFSCEKLTPVCLASDMLVRTWTTGIISGWKTDYFKGESLNVTEQEIQLTTVRSKNCTKIQGSRVSKQAVMCPLKNESKPSCKGNAGAPIIVPVKNRFHLIGIMSKTIIDDDCEKHDIYPLICIQKYFKWIHRMIKKEENRHFHRHSMNHAY